MGAKSEEPSLNVRDIRDALPTAKPVLKAPTSKPMPPTLPDCFADVWRKRHSKLPLDRHQRAAIQAVATSLPSDVTSLSGQSAAAIYLAAITMSLDRLIGTTKPMKNDEEASGMSKTMGKKERRKMKKMQKEKEKQVKDMPIAEVIGKKDEKGIAQMDVENNDIDQDGKDEDLMLIASLMSLLGMAVRGTSHAVLNAKCERVLDVCMRAHDHVNGHSFVARHASVVFAGVLAVMDATSWSKPPVQRSYLYLLRSTSDRNPKSRRKAREALGGLLRSPRGPLIRLKASAAAAIYFVEEIHLETTRLEDSLKQGGEKEERLYLTRFVHVLTSIERSALALGPHDAAKVGKQLLLVAMKNFKHVSSFSFDALASLFKHVDEGGKDGKDGYTAPLIPKTDLEKLLRTALEYEISPDFIPETVVAYVTCILNGTVAHADYFSFAPPPREFLIQPVQKVCSLVNPRAGRTEITKQTAAQLMCLVNQKWLKCRSEILAELIVFTGMAYRAIWPDFMPVIRVYMEDSMAAGNFKMRTEIGRLAKTVVSFHEKAVVTNDGKLQQLAASLASSIIRGGGAEHVLNACELKYDKKAHVTNPWILPILRSNLCGAPLSVFTTRLLPLANDLQAAMEKTISEKRTVETKNLGIYYSQIWSLLPGFCKKPSDLGQDGVLSDAFKSIFTSMVAKDQTVMYPIATAALRHLSESVAGLDATDITTKKKHEAFSNRLKKLFPTISSLAERTNDDRRGLLLEALRKACIASNRPELVSNLLRKSIRRLLELQLKTPGSQQVDDDSMQDDGDNILRKQLATADIAIAIAESRTVPVDAAETTFLEKAMSPYFLDSKQSAMQKKAYRASALLVSVGAAIKSHEEFVQFSKSIAAARKQVSAGAKAARQGLIAALVGRHSKLKESSEKLRLVELITDEFLTEVVLATRDKSEKTRAAAFDTLVELARGWHLTSSGIDTKGLQQFFMAVASGFGGKSVGMLSATLTSVGRLMYEFRGESAADKDLGGVVDSFFASSVNESGGDVTMGEKDTEVVVEAGPVTILLRHDTYEVQKAALGVVKIGTKVLADPPDRLIGLLPGIIPGLVHVASRSKKQETRLKVRVILERLLRKCGRETLEKHFPEEHSRLLKAVRKKFSRELVKKHEGKERKRRAAEGREEVRNEDEDYGVSDSDSDMEREIVDGDDLLAKRKREREVDMGMREGEDSVVDLLDAGSGASVMTRREVERGAGRKRGIEKEIRYTEDGKPILVESDAESGGAEAGSVDSESEDDSVDVRVGKRRRGDGEERKAKRMKGAFGEEYRSERGRGDVKRAGRPDPYAYIPLGGAMLGEGGKSGGGSLSRLHRRKKDRKGRRGVPGKR